MLRPRACGALLHDNCVLMVRHVSPARAYWTLPGGGLEAGETPADAAVREMQEETGVRATVVRLLFEAVYGDDQSPDYCFLMAAVDGTLEIELGADPEEAHLAQDKRLLQSVSWRRLTEMQNDPQVSAVLKALGEEAKL